MVLGGIVRIGPQNVVNGAELYRFVLPRGARGRQEDAGGGGGAPADVLHLARQAELVAALLD